MQYYLITLLSQSFSDVLFLNYGWSPWGYSLIPALFLPVLVAECIVLRFQKRLQNRETGRAYLLTGYRNLPNYLGEAYMKLNDYQNAIKHLKRAIALGNNRSSTYEHLAWSYLRTGDEDLALSNYTMVVELNPKNGIAYYNRAKILFGKGKKERSTSDLRKSCNLDYENSCITL